MKRIVIIFFILIGAYLLYNTVQNFSWINGNNRATSKLSNNIDEIEINVASARLQIIPEKRDNVVADFDGKGKIKVSEQRNKITIKQEQPFFQWFSFFENPSLTVYIPEDYDRDLTIELGSGNVTLEGTNREPIELNRLAIDMSSGNGYFKHLAVDDFSYDVSSGNVAIDSLEVVEGNFNISSGNIKVNDYVGKMNADISSGRFQLQVRELIDSIQIDVSSGNVDLDLPDDADFSLDADIGSGKISYDFPLTIEEHDGNDIKGKHKSGKHLIKLDVSSGKINIH